MGFQHVELMVEGHNTKPPLAPPTPSTTSAWYYADGRGEEKNRLLMQQLPPVTDAAQTYHPPCRSPGTTRPGSVTAPFEFLRANKERLFCAWHRFPTRIIRSTAPSVERLHHPDDVDLPEHRTMDLERRPWWHKESLYGTPKMENAELRNFREKHSRTPVQSDRQLRDLIANYYG